jgi:hypothetical protein
LEEKIPEEPQAALIPWTIGDIAKGIGVVIGFLFLLIILTVVVGVAIAISMLGVGGLAELGPEGVQQFLASEAFLDRFMPVALALNILFEGAFFFAAWLFSSVKYHCGWQALGFRSFKLKRAALLVAVVLFAGLLINLLYEWMLPAPTLPQEFTQTGVSLAIFAVLAVMVAPFAEETFFRGFIFAGIGKRFGYGWGAVASALLFALPHILTYMQIGALLPVFILGLLLAWLYMRTHSIWPCIFTHFAYNSIAILFMVI